MCVPTTAFALSVAAAAGILVPSDHELMHGHHADTRLLDAVSDVQCAGGQAGPYPCDNVDLLAFFPKAQMGCSALNDLWGWTDPQTGVEYALVGCNNGVAFVDLSDPTDPVYVGKLPHHSSPSGWRDIAVTHDYAFVGSEAFSHGLQAFDLRRLREVTNPPATFTEDGHLGNFGQSHTVTTHEGSDYVYVVGSSSQPAPGCNSGLHVVDVSTPDQPQTAGCYTGDGYTHETDCLTYRGPDPEFFGRVICFAANEDTLTIVDVHNPASQTQLAREGYPGDAYTHQTWLTEDHRFLVLDDEFDEVDFGHNTRTHIWNVEDLDAPVYLGFHDGPTTSIDHNQYVNGDFLYQGNYTSGVAVLDVSDIENLNLQQIGFFDTYPQNNSRNFDGVWGTYAFFESGSVIASNIGEGLFVLRPHPPADTAVLVARDASGPEGDDASGSLEFTVSLSQPPTGTVTVAYSTLEGTAKEGVDYVATSGTLSFSGSTTTATVAVPILGNTDLQPDRSFFLHIIDADGAKVWRSKGKGTLLDDDLVPTPALSVADASVPEGDSGTTAMEFVVSLSAVSEEAVQFAYATADGTAEGGIDYQPASGTATIAAGAQQTVVDVAVIGNDTPQDDRQFTLTISDPVHAEIDRATATGTILDDDLVPLPSLAVADASVVEGDTGTVTLEFVVSLSAISDEDVQFDYATADGTAEGGIDYEPASGTATLAAGLQERIVEVTVFSNEVPQQHRQLTLTISDPVNADIERATATGAILDDDRLAAEVLFPPFGVAAGGESVLILGENFIDGVTVDFGSTEAASVSVLAQNALQVKTPPLTPGQLYTVTVEYDPAVANPASAPLLPTIEQRFLANFLDVPTGSTFHPVVETLRRGGISEGCGDGLFCVGEPIRRRTMASLLLRARWGADYQPPGCTGIFADVPCSDPDAAWIEALHAQGVTGGCDTAPLRFCPEATTTRAAMAVFLLRAFEGPDYFAPACSGVFDDVACPSNFASWVEELVQRNITAGCATEPARFCPGDTTSTGQSAAFVVATFGLSFPN